MKQRYGGISRYFYELTTRIPASVDADVNLFQGLYINDYNLSRSKSKFEFYKGHKIPPIKYTGLAVEMLNKIWFERTFSKLPSIDVYHPTYYRKDLHKYNQKPIVLTVYDMIHELYNEQFSNKGFIKTKHASINTADAIIAISKNTKKDLIEIYDIPESKITVIYLANSLMKSSNINFEEIKLTYCINCPYILYVGVRGGYKNFSILLDAYSSHFSDQFNLVCFGGNEFNQEELTFIKNKGLSTKIIYLNGSDDLLSSLYSNAFCFVYPSLYEGFGIPPLEAMSLGCPVIASNSSSIPEVVEDSALLFDPTSIDSLINTIESLICNDLKRDKIIKRGFEQNEKFTWEKTVGHTLDVYRNLYI